MGKKNSFAMLKITQKNICKILNNIEPPLEDVERDICSICKGDDIIYEDSNYVCKNCGSTQIDFRSTSVESIDAHEFNTYSFNGNISDSGSVLVNNRNKNLKVKLRFIGKSSFYGPGFILRNGQSCYLDSLEKKLSINLEDYMVIFEKKKTIRKLFKDFPDYKEEIIGEIEKEKKNIDPIDFVLKNCSINYSKPDEEIINETIDLFMKIRAIKTSRDKNKWGVIAGCLESVSKKRGIIYRSDDLCEIFDISRDYLNKGSSFITKQCNKSFELNSIFIGKNKIFLVDYKDGLEALFPKFDLRKLNIINMFIDRLINTKFDNSSTAPSIMAWILKNCQMKYNLKISDIDIKNTLSVSSTIIQRYKNISVYIYL